MFRWHQHFLCKTSRSQMGLFEAATHRIIAVAAIMATIARDMGGHDHPITNLEWTNGGSNPQHLPRGFRSQDPCRRHFLREKLLQGGAAEAAGTRLDARVAACACGRQGWLDDTHP